MNMAVNIFVRLIFPLCAFDRGGYLVVFKLRQKPFSYYWAFGCDKQAILLSKEEDNRLETFCRVVRTAEADRQACLY